MKIIAENRRAKFDYFLEDYIEAGIMLLGTEIKALRDGRANIAESYAAVEGREIVLVNADTCIGCKLCSWACPYGAREFDEEDGVMKKCTLCVDKIYNENLPEEDRVPACVSTCPANARHFGDLGDPDSSVSRMVAERGGVELMPELGYKPVNRYLPPRPKKTGCGSGKSAALEPAFDPAAMHPALRWLDRILTR